MNLLFKHSFLLFRFEDNLELYLILHKVLKMINSNTLLFFIKKILIIALQGFQAGCVFDEFQNFKLKPIINLVDIRLSYF